MKTIHAIFVALLLVMPAVAETPAAAAPAILALAPEDALAILYVSNPQDIFSHPLWSVSGAADDPLLAELLTSTSATFDGPTMLAVCGSPMNPLGLRVEIAVRPANIETFYKQYESAWSPALAKLAGQTSSPVETAGDQRILHLPAPMPMGIFTLAKDGVIYGSSRPTDVSTWQAGQELPPRFVRGADAGRLAADALANVDLLVYVNLRSLMPLARAELRFLPEAVLDRLGLEKVEFGMLAASWSQPGPQVEAVFGVPSDAGIVDLIAPRNAPLDIPSVIPADYTSFTRTAMTSLDDGIERINGYLNAVDPAIVAEFREECTELQRAYGFDPLTDFAANFVDEWVIAAKLNDAGPPTMLVAARLAAPDQFRRHAEQLIRGFELEVQETPVEGGVIYSAAPETGVHFAWAAVGQHLFAASSPATITKAIQARAEGKVMLTSASLASVMPRLPAEPARLIFTNFKEVARMALRRAENSTQAAAVIEPLQKLAELDAGAALAITRGDNLLALRLVVSPSADEYIRAAAWNSIGGTLAKSRQHSQRMKSSGNMRGLLVACFTYAHDHDDAWPASLSDLVEAGIIDPLMLCRPGVRNCGAAGSEPTFYLYRNGTGLDPEQVVICERELQDGGANFGFADGHAEWISGDRARALHALMVLGQP